MTVWDYVDSLPFYAVVALLMLWAVYLAGRELLRYLALRKDPGERLHAEAEAERKHDEALRDQLIRAYTAAQADAEKLATRLAEASRHVDHLEHRVSRMIWALRECAAICPECRDVIEAAFGEEIADVHLNHPPGGRG